jgi:cytochrome P450
MPTDFNPFAPEHVANPYPIYHQMRREAPVYYYAPWNVWLVTRYADVDSVLRSSEVPFGFADPERDLSADASQACQSQNARLLEHFNGWLLSRHGKEHFRIRRLAKHGLRQDLIVDMKESVRRFAGEVIDEVIENQGKTFTSGGPVSMDFVDQFSKALSVRVIAKVLGIPQQDCDLLRNWSNRMGFYLHSGEKTEETVAVMHTTLDKMEAYFLEIFAARRRAPRQDMIGQLVAANEAGISLTDDELFALCTLLIPAGQLTTSHFLGNALATLLQHQQILEELRRDPTRIPRAVEELLRYETPFALTIRSPSEPLAIGSQVIQTGERIFLMLGAANRDPEIYSEPDVLNIDREELPHIAFGVGVHSCIGAALARMVGAVALETILCRMEQIELADEPLAWTPHPNFRALEHLRIRFLPKGGLGEEHSPRNRSFLIQALEDVFEASVLPG